MRVLIAAGDASDEVKKIAAEKCQIEVAEVKQAGEANEAVKEQVEANDAVK